MPRSVYNIHTIQIWETADNSLF